MTLMMLQQDTDDVDTVSAVLGGMYPKVRLDPPRGTVRFQADIRGDEHLTIARLSMGFHAEVVVEPEGVFTSATRLGGRLRTVHGDGGNVGGVVFGQEETNAEYDRSELLVVNMPETALLQRALRAEGADSGTLRLRGHHPLAEHADLWAKAVGHVYQNVVQVDSVFQNDLIRAAAFDYLLAIAARALPFEVVTRALASTGAGAATIRRAMAYIDSHLTDAITIDDVAAAARVSPRGLQAAFRRQLDMTPMTYLRRARLAEAHQELLDDETKTIGAVAAKWGFSNQGRFTRLRRDMYGSGRGDGSVEGSGTQR
jgi:AraC-like DNA-binding protein